MELLSFYLAALILWIVLCAVVAYNANQRGRSGFAWFGLSILTFPLIGFILWFVAPKLSGEAWFGLSILTSLLIDFILLFIIPNLMEEYWKDYKNISRRTKKFDEKNDLPSKTDPM